VLDVALENVTFAYRGSRFAVRDVTLTFPKSTATAIVGPPASGASTLLRIIAGHLRPSAGDIRIGARIVTNASPARRPLLYVTSALEAPGRWSVRHLLVAAVRQRSLDREDRHHECELAVAKWNLQELVDRTLRSLSSSERTLANLARIELLRPAILVADRLIENASTAIADDFYRTLRVMGTTVISAPASKAELGLTDRVIVLENGRVVQDSAPSHVYRHPTNESAARATGEVNIIPITVRANVVQSPIGSWQTHAGFEGPGIALARPEDFFIAAAGEESDLIFAIEEASFREGRWLATGLLSGGVTLRVSLPGELAIEKGRLFPLCFDAAHFKVRPLQLPSEFRTI
jgi:ABC-type sugar transport system ATPase subunit